MATVAQTDIYQKEQTATGLEVAGYDRLLSWHWRTWPPALRRAVLLLLACLVGLTAYAFGLTWAHNYLSKQAQKQNSLKLTAQKSLQNSGQERLDIESNLPLLQELQSIGVYGEEKRLEWIEQLRGIEKRWPGVAITYDIPAQTLLQDPNSPTPMVTAAQPDALASRLPSGEPAASFGVFTTQMKLSMKVPHEGDVLAILSELKSAQLGRFDVTQCTMRRVTIPGTPSGYPPSVESPLDVQCTLQWISMKTYQPPK